MPLVPIPLLQVEQLEHADKFAFGVALTNTNASINNEAYGSGQIITAGQDVWLDTIPGQPSTPLGLTTTVVQATLLTGPVRYVIPPASFSNVAVRLGQVTDFAGGNPNNFVSLYTVPSTGVDPNTGLPITTPGQEQTFMIVTQLPGGNNGPPYDDSFAMVQAARVTNLIPSKFASLGILANASGGAGANSVGTPNGYRIVLFPAKNSGGNTVPDTTQPITALNPLINSALDPAATESRVTFDYKAGILRLSIPPPPAGSCSPATTAINPNNYFDSSGRVRLFAIVYAYDGRFGAGLVQNLGGGSTASVAWGTLPTTPFTTNAGPVLAGGNGWIMSYGTGNASVYFDSVAGLTNTVGFEIGAIDTSNHNVGYFNYAHSTTASSPDTFTFKPSSLTTQTSYVFQGAGGIGGSFNDIPLIQASFTQTTFPYGGLLLKTSIGGTNGQTARFFAGFNNQDNLLIASNANWNNSVWAADFNGAPATATKFGDGYIRSYTKQITTGTWTDTFDPTTTVGWDYSISLAPEDGGLQMLQNQNIPTSGFNILGLGVGAWSPHGVSIPFGSAAITGSLLLGPLAIPNSIGSSPNQPTVAGDAHIGNSLLVGTGTQSVTAGDATLGHTLLVGAGSQPTTAGQASVATSLLVGTGFQPTTAGHAQFYDTTATTSSGGILPGFPPPHHVQIVGSNNSGISGSLFLWNLNGIGGSGATSIDAATTMQTPDASAQIKFIDDSFSADISVLCRSLGPSVTTVSSAPTLPYTGTQAVTTTDGALSATFPTSGTLSVPTNNTSIPYGLPATGGFQIITYTGISGAQFTGCTSQSNATGSLTTLTFGITLLKPLYEMMHLTGPTTNSVNGIVNTGGTINFLSNSDTIGTEGTIKFTSTSLAGTIGTTFLDALNSGGLLSIGSVNSISTTLASSTASGVVDITAGTAGSHGTVNIANDSTTGTVFIGNNSVATALNTVVIDAKSNFATITMDAGTLGNGGTISIGNVGASTIAIGASSTPPDILIGAPSHGLYNIIIGQSGLAININGNTTLGSSASTTTTIGPWIEGASLYRTMTSVTTTPYDVRNFLINSTKYLNDSVLLVTPVGGGTHIIVPPIVAGDLTSPYQPGFCLLVMDVAGTAGANNITIEGNISGTGASNFLSAASSPATTWVINTNYGFAKILLTSNSNVGGGNFQATYNVLEHG